MTYEQIYTRIKEGNIQCVLDYLHDLPCTTPEEGFFYLARLRFATRACKRLYGRVLGDTDTYGRKFRKLKACPGVVSSRLVEIVLYNRPEMAALREKEG